MTTTRRTEAGDPGYWDRIRAAAEHTVSRKAGMTPAEAALPGIAQLFAGTDEDRAQEAS